MYKLTYIGNSSNSVELHCFCELEECKAFAVINNRETGLPWGWLASRDHMATTMDMPTKAKTQAPHNNKNENPFSIKS
jgi:hypothetical protein